MVSEAMASKIKEIQFRPLEEVHVFHPDTGEHLFCIQGDEEMVDLGGYTHAIRDKNILHNHPSCFCGQCLTMDPGFSPEDIVLMSTCNIRGMYLVEGNVLLEVIRPGDSWPVEFQIAAMGLSALYSRMKSQIAIEAELSSIFGQPSNIAAQKAKLAVEATTNLLNGLFRTLEIPVRRYHL